MIFLLQALRCVCKSVCVFYANNILVAGLFYFYILSCIMNFMLACTHMNLFWSQFYNGIFYCSFTLEKKTSKIICLLRCWFVWVWPCGCRFFRCIWKYSSIKILRAFNIDWWWQRQKKVRGRIFVKMWNGYLTKFLFNFLESIFISWHCSSVHTVDCFGRIFSVGIQQKRTWYFW